MYADSLRRKRSRTNEELFCILALRSYENACCAGCKHDGTDEKSMIRARQKIVSFAVVFGLSRNAPPKGLSRNALPKVFVERAQKTAAKETRQKNIRSPGAVCNEISIDVQLTCNEFFRDKVLGNRFGHS